MSKPASNGDGADASFISCSAPLGHFYGLFTWVTLIHSSLNKLKQQIGTGDMANIRLAVAACVALTIMACGSSPPPSDSDVGQSPLPIDRFSIVNQCYALRSVATDGLVVANETGGYDTSVVAPENAEAFFMRAATLGKYLLYATDTRLLTSASPAAGQSAPSDAAIWTIDPVPDSDAFTLYSDDASLALAVNDAGALTLADPGDTNTTHFEFVPTSVTCAIYPEMPVAVTGDSFKGNGINKPAVGFADVHTHMGMSSELSYAGDVGPSAGGVLYGEVIHRFGVPHALEDCLEFHGPQGVLDANQIISGTVGTHETEGWPTFIDWPQRDYLTHQVMYYKWVERAWLAGLRLMVNHGTNIQALCNVGKLYSLAPLADCDDMSIAVKQVQYLYEVQDYVDAQHGGPGKGWFRIVTSPQQAREVINDGKLAVVLGVEVAQVFNCGVNLAVGLAEVPECDQAQIDAEIDRLWELGVRHVYPYHDINSALGGTGIFSDIMNLLGLLDTGAFWEVEACRDYPEDEPSVRTPGLEIATSLPGLGDDPLTAAILGLTGGSLPVYPDGKSCNKRTVTELGAYALQALMDKRMVIDIDHAAYHSKDIMLDIAESQNPPYPMASSHDAHGGLTSDQAQRMLASGGIIYPYKGNGVKHVEFLEKLKFWREKAGVPDDRILGLGFGADANGFGGHPGPRGGDSEPVQYPFTLFQGADWGPQFAGVDPVSVGLLTIPESGKFWHIDEVGMAHYGLVADFVEEVRLEGGREALDALYNSAEGYLQMWERTYNRETASDES